MENQSVGRVFFQHQFPILRKGGKGIGKNHAVGVALRGVNKGLVDEINNKKTKGISKSVYKI